MESSELAEQSQNSSFSQISRINIITNCLLALLIYSLIYQKKKIHMEFEVLKNRNSLKVQVPMRLICNPRNPSELNTN